MIYLNNCATSYPKPPGVVQAVSKSLESIPHEEGRGLDRGEDIVGLLRAELTDFLHAVRSERLILTTSATHGLNMVIQGIFENGRKNHCVTTKLEHNSVLRPLTHLRNKGRIEVDFISLQEAVLYPEALVEKIKDKTGLVVINHASNVTGDITPIRELASLCYERGIPCLIDASQSIGSRVELDMRLLPGNVIILFTGHKGLYGPSGTGGFYIGEEIEDFQPILQGGTGIRSDLMTQPDDLPLRFETGTPNLPGYAGLLEGLRFVRDKGVKKISSHKHALIQSLHNHLADLPGITTYPAIKGDFSAGALSFNIEGWNPEDVGFALDQSFGIICRTGLHCAPLIHEEIGSAPLGTVRLSVSFFTTMDEIDHAVEALKHLAGLRKG
jgi:cysteine desulfurase/selenocysteine lyase